MKVIAFSRDFHEKVILRDFTTFRAASLKTSSFFTTPLMISVVLWSSEQSTTKISNFSENVEFPLNFHHFHENGGFLGDFSTFRAPGTKTYKFLVIFRAF